MKPNFDDNALDALIASAILPHQHDSELTDDEVQHYLDIFSAQPSTPEEQESLDLITRRVRASLAGNPLPTRKAQTAMIAFAAMNRKNEDNQFDQETSKSLEEARERARQELLKAQKESDHDH